MPEADEQWKRFVAGHDRLPNQPPPGSLEVWWFPECAGRKFLPSNGTDGMLFGELWCGTCAHYRKFSSTGKKLPRASRDWDYEDCEKGITVRAMVADWQDGKPAENSPEEWRYDERGRPSCSAWRSDARR